MTEIPTTPTEQTPTPTPTEASPTPPAAPTRSRRRLIIGIAAGLVGAVLVGVGVLLTLTVLNANAIALHTSADEEYSVMAPGEPIQEQTALLPLGLPTTATHWIDGERYYSVTTANGEDLPPTPIWRGMFLHEALVGALRAPGVSESSLDSDAITNAFLAEPEQIMLSGAPAFQFELTIDGAPAPFHVVFTGHGTKLYMVVFSDSADSHDEDFLESFTYLV
jgi:hypothetical protein